MHLDNQSRELVGRDLVMPHIAADDLRHLIGIDPRWRVLFCHRVLPDFLILAVVVELALRPAIIPDRCSLTNKILLIFHLRLKRWLRVRVASL